MNVGQTSVVVFASKLLGSILGFLATLYFARLLGAEIVGYYAVTMSIVSWLKLGGTLGVSEAVVKRISEGEDPEAFYTAGIVVVFVFGIVLSLGVILTRDIMASYIGADVWPFVVALLLTGLFVTYVQSALKGRHKVHIAGILTPTNLTISSLTQIGLVFGSFGLAGMLGGYLLGELIVGVVGLLFLSIGIKRPSRHHFDQLFDFAKYSWLGGLKIRSFNDVDILILAALVPAPLVGVYSIAWSISKFLSLFGSSVRSAIFPEISFADSSDDDERITQLTADSVAFIGLIAIPGLFGGIVLADRLLLIYGEEFTRGTSVLGLLILATLVYSYQQHLMVIIRAIDRPDIAFRINAIFIVANLLLNVVLVLWIGWVGAALATVVSAAVGLILAYRALRRIVDFDIPLGELVRQFAAAGLMAAIVFGLRRILETGNLVQYNITILVLLVGIGAGIYFLTLLGISDRFRRTVVANSPFAVPFLS